MISEPSRPSGKPLLVAVAGGVLGAAGLLALVLSLGSWAYQHRRFTLHDGRLKRLVQQHPGAEEVTRAVLAESGNSAVPGPKSEDELRALGARWSPDRADEIVSKRREWGTVRIFEAGGMIYFLYFDGEGKLRDYVLVGGGR